MPCEAAEPAPELAPFIEAFAAALAADYLRRHPSTVVEVESADG